MDSLTLTPQNPSLKKNKGEKKKSGQGTFEVSPKKRAGRGRGRAHTALASLQETFQNTGFTFSTAQPLHRAGMQHTLPACAEQHRFHRQTSFEKQLMAGKCQNTCLKLQRGENEKK